jgi:hypothetical protein
VIEAESCQLLRRIHGVPTSGNSPLTAAKSGHFPESVQSKFTTPLIYFKTRKGVLDTRDHFVSPPISIMAPSRSHSRPGWLFSLIAIFSLFSQSSALYFYLDGTTPKCFYEELPKDTMVVGM